MENSKPFWMSKTIWVNALTIAGLIIVGQAGITTETWAEISTVTLAVVNLVLRFVTGEPIVWSQSSE